ncbi:hypothetical protein FEM33_15555 [Dyadobacter flavalbus]|uniref:Uncharacterized protein n=1 Tax=Dyadobacter flavalbus TaxID=2579942 RepID=A0A5M8QVJ4_9BACT|nr:hypothetical protein [Dyadobacter flavalbus]KAA6438834.1 hypothetical protein FEM33_15555 [Dyadobacter flavalbus]
MLITPQLKDAFLQHIVSEYNVGQIIEWPREQNILGLDKYAIAEMINHFVRIKLFRYSIDRNGKPQPGTKDSIIFFINMEAHDFIQEGGFYGKYQLLQKNIEKLLYEVEKLEHAGIKTENDLQTIRKNIVEYSGLIANVVAIGDSFKDAF